MDFTETCFRDGKRIEATQNIDQLQVFALTMLKPRDLCRNVSYRPNGKATAWTSP